MAVLDRITRWLAPPPPPPASLWEPPALSAAASAPQRPTNGPTAQAAPASTTTAANSPVPLSLRPPRPREWQAKAWEAYRTVGAARQAVDWLAHGLSRCHLYIGRVVADGAGDPEPLEDPGVAGEILSELHDGPVGQAAMLKRLAVGLLVAGETWLAGYPKPATATQTDPAGGEFTAAPPTENVDDIETAWTVVSRREWQEGGENSIRLKLARHPELGPDGWVSFPADKVVLVPIYDPDPEDALYPTSAFEAALKDIDELNGLSDRVWADIRSRLAGAGILAIAESATLPNPSASSGVNPLHGDPFLQALLAAARSGIQNPADPSATVPITIKVPDEAVSGGIRHITFSTPFDAQIPILRQDARRTLAADLDIPANIVTGVEDLNHWASWAVDDQAIKAHLGPLASMICTTLTIDILWPALRAADQDEIESLCIWWDASEITLRPDRSQTTLLAHQQNLISGKAARRELSFSEEDAPDSGDAPPPGQPGEAASDDGTAAPADHPAAGQDAVAQAAQRFGIDQTQNGQPRGGQAHPSATPNPPASPGGVRTISRPAPPG